MSAELVSSDFTTYAGVLTAVLFTLPIIMKIIHMVIVAKKALYDKRWCS